MVGQNERTLRMFFFSGTGNARNVARWMVEVWRERDHAAEAVDLATVDVDAVEVGPRDDIGLASPTHGFNFPPITLAFLFRFPRTIWGNRVCIVNTRGGVRVFGVYVPGLSGVAQLLAALVFLLKGYRVVGMRPIDLPSNWISLHPGLRADVIRAIYERCEAVTRRSANRLLDGQRDLRALFDLPQDLLIAPIALGYYLVGRYLFAKSFIASASCDACGACISHCPVQAVRLVAGRPFWSHRCESCMRCMNRCPKRAIETAHGFIAGFLFLFDVALLALIHPALRPVASMFSGSGVVGTLCRLAFDTALMLAALFLSYRLLHRGLRFRLIERLMVLTSLTHFGFWRRYRPPSQFAGTVRIRGGTQS
jgi:Pyruvate/2-oxoacid:ferredoxin oxidoreductase delta subunit